METEKQFDMFWLNIIWNADILNEGIHWNQNNSLVKIITSNYKK